MPKASWDARYSELAAFVANWGEDADRKVGCVIAGADNTLIAIGFNGLPRSVVSSVPSRFLREGGEKYKWIEHAERNAIFAASRNGISLVGTTMFLTWFPCEGCARAIIQVGISRLVAYAPDENDPVWGDRFRVSKTMLTEADIELVYSDR